MTETDVLHDNITLNGITLYIVGLLIVCYIFIFRLNSCQPYGSQAGDVYSFGLVLQEIIFRALPYFYGAISPQGNSLHNCAQIDLLFCIAL